MTYNRGWLLQFFESRRPPELAFSLCTQSNRFGEIVADHVVCVGQDGRDTNGDASFFSFIYYKS
jgi:hypothetical protein